MASYEHGFEDERFENAVSQNFHCPICMNVFKDPVMCQRNQHSFCFPCITRHLENSQTCPSCMEELTLDTLRQPPRVLSECLSELNIRCDYFSRGCHQFVQLEKLESHVKDCGFAPVVCSNEGCLVEINKRDKIHHEAEVCKLRRVKCHNCAGMTNMMEEVNDKLDEIKEELSIVKDTLYEMEEIKLTLTAVEEDVTVVKGRLNEIEDNFVVVKDKLNEMDGFQKQLVQLETVPDEILRIKIRQDEILKEIRETRQGTTNEKPSIVVAGGRTRGYDTLRSSEIFNWSTMSWSYLEPMSECREGASSFIYKNQLTVAGGWTEGDKLTNSMEQMNIGPIYDRFAQCQWRDSPVRLPGKLYGHSTTVYKNWLIVIGGFEDGRGYSDSIHKVLLHPPYTLRQLATMPEPRVFHRTELFGDKIFIFGGRSAASYKDSVNSIVIYDITRNKCQQMTSLAISDMTTVKWSDNVIILGGKHIYGNPLNTAVIFDVKTGKSNVLPEMKFKRRDCAAVVCGNTIVVMGGVDESGNSLKSVESFTFERYSWEDLPPMNEGRFRHTIVTF